VRQYAKAQGMWRDAGSPDPIFTDTLELDMGTVEPSLAGPKRPQDRVVLSNAAPEFKKHLETVKGKVPEVPVKGGDYAMKDGHVAIAAITSCTNTSNPSVMLAAGLVAKKANALGMKVKPWVKTSLAPGSQVVTDYLAKADVQKDLDALGFNLVGYGCTTCIGNSGPLPDAIAAAVTEGDLNVVSVLSGNRNFEGRVNPHVKSNYLASPPLCVVYALAGSMLIDITKEAIGKDKNGKDVFLKDIWPTNKEVADTVAKALTPEMFKARYADVFKGTKEWQAITGAEGQTYTWEANSTYVANPPYFVNMPKKPGAVTDVKGAKVIAIFGDSITTDHISPAGSIKKDGPAGKYLIAHGVTPADFNSYGARRGHHEVMMRGTFANIRIKNELCGGVEGGITKYAPTAETLSIYDAAMKYKADGTPLVVVAGKEYGTGSSRDWAAKGTNLLGVRAVIAESFERIHRSNLVGMGVLPLVFKNGQTRADLKLDGTETLDITGVAAGISPRMDVTLTITRVTGAKETHTLLCRIDTLDEVEYFKNGGILPYVLRGIGS
ncbi:MAG: aconitate hydratase AcnA, partial [Alphaproteobacteria bacterium]|nr:aconitate hydratase AcnA [Alphaproteobacteria bacterium]